MILGWTEDPTRTEQIYVFVTMKAEGKGLDPVKQA